MKMRLMIILGTALVVVAVFALSNPTGSTTSAQGAQSACPCPPTAANTMPAATPPPVGEPVPAAQTIPEVITLGKDAKLGPVTFNHVKHNSGEYQVNGAAIACTTCHHTAQPVADLAKHPGMKTSWPADRTTVLTKDLFDKDPKAAGVAACRECHARDGMKPNLLAAIPKFKPEGGNEISMTNLQAFHRTCTGCHAEVKKAKPDTKAPTQLQCVMCHKKTA